MGVNGASGGGQNSSQSTATSAVNAPTFIHTITIAAADDVPPMEWQSEAEEPMDCESAGTVISVLTSTVNVTHNCRVS
ncbi:hypothetical protein PFLUV_G00239050 [Perca fluviatilis]|uniref:Uncharacterized protein n=1 Tax=Perca fluviatilis TaxID=8168 RepID=A0A6A5DP16_PERFL|nr:hypothetical protein PFLUV_G00239050 [Perca fluviatilis]